MKSSVESDATLTPTSVMCSPLPRSERAGYRIRVVVVVVVVGAALLASACFTLATRATDVATDAAAFIARIEGPQASDPDGPGAFTLLERMRKHGVPGAGIAVIKDFTLHWAKGYGVADVQTGAHVDARTLFQAASVSKPVTAMAVLKAAEQGRIALDADVNKALRSWKVPEGEHTRVTPVTPRALLAHVSGADDGFGFPGYDPAGPWPTLVQILAGEKPSNVGPVLFGRPPFAAYKYSGGGFTILQLALADAIGKPFAELMREMVLDPLGMADSTFEQPPPPRIAATTARGHGVDGESMDAKWRVHPEQAAAGLWTTPTDLARFVIEIQQALRGPAGRVLAHASAREMVTPVGVGPFAAGLVIARRGEGWYVHHGGANWGFRCAIVAHVRQGYGVVVMTNSDSGGAILREVEARVAAAYGWDLLDKPR